MIEFSLVNRHSIEDLTSQICLFISMEYKDAGRESLSMERQKFLKQMMTKVLSPEDNVNE